MAERVSRLAEKSKGVSGQLRDLPTLLQQHICRVRCPPPALLLTLRQSLAFIDVVAFHYARFVVVLHV